MDKENFLPSRLPYVSENIIKKFVNFMQEHTNSFKLFDEVIDVVESLFDMNLKLSIVTTIPEFKFVSVNLLENILLRW